MELVQILFIARSESLLYTMNKVHLVYFELPPRTAAHRLVWAEFLPGPHPTATPRVGIEAPRRARSTRSQNFVFKFRGGRIDFSRGFSAHSKGRPCPFFAPLRQSFSSLPPPT